MEKEPTIKDVMTTLNGIVVAINETSSKMDARFNRIEDRLERLEVRFVRLEERFARLEARFSGLEQRFSSLEQRINGMEAVMVTKDYLDKKIADVQGYLVSLMRRADGKLLAVVDKLQEKKIFSGDESKGIKRLEPFPDPSATLL